MVGLVTGTARASGEQSARSSGAADEGAKAHDEPAIAGSSGPVVRRDIATVLGSFRVLPADKAALDRELAKNGFSGVGLAAPTYGFGLDVSWNHLRFGVDVAYGVDQTLRRATDHATASWSSSLGSFDVGYDVYTGRLFTIYPLVGLSFGGDSIDLDPSKAPLAPAAFARYASEKTVKASTNSIATNLGVGFSAFFPFMDPHRKRRFGTPGLTLDVRAGYLVSISRDDWQRDSDALSGLPQVRLEGPYVRLALGFSLAQERYAPR